MSDLYIIRHGQASFASDNYDRLSDLGRSQAGILGDYFNQIGASFDHWYSGSMERQKDTLTIIQSRMADASSEFSVLPELNEYESDEVVQAYLPAVIEDHPSLREHVDKMLTSKRSFQLVFEKIMIRWASGRYRQPGICTFADFASRVRLGLDAIMKQCGRGKTVAVVSSGGPLCVVMQQALNLTSEDAIRVNWMIKNASVSVFKYNSSGIALSSFNSVAHLDQQRDSDLITYR